MARYRGRLSGPLRDRLDLTVEVPAVLAEVLGQGARGESSLAVRTRVIAARDRQHERYSAARVTANARLTPALLATHCQLDSAGIRVLTAAVQRLGLTARGYDRVRKVARTIADLDQQVHVTADHVAEALQFRLPT